MRPFFDSAVAAMLGGVAVYFVRAAPFVQPPFKDWAGYLIAAGTAYVVLARLGVFGHAQRLLG